MTEGKCAIWGTPAVVSNEEQQILYDSPRAGGKYKTIGNMNHLSGIPLQQKAKLTTWLVDRRLSGEEAPFVSPSTEFAIQIARTDLLSTTKRLEKFFHYCFLYKNRIGSKVFFRNLSSAYSEFMNKEKNDSDDLLYSYIEILNEEDVQRFTAYLIEVGFISDRFVLTSKAFEKIDELNSSNINSKQAFVAMWFDPSIQALYENAIRPAIEDAQMPSGVKFQARKIDNKEHNNKIDDEIIAEIRKSRFVIADFTSDVVVRNKKRQAISRGGVYYEAGFAQGLGLPVIWTCKQGFEDLIHFDVRQYNTIFWKDEADLYNRLKKRIEATIT